MYKYFYAHFTPVIVVPGCTWKRNLETKTHVSFLFGGFVTLLGVGP